MAITVSPSETATVPEAGAMSARVTVTSMPTMPAATVDAVITVVVAIGTTSAQVSRNAPRVRFGQPSTRIR